MINPKKLEEIAKQISASVPQGVKQFGEDAETKVKQILQAQLNKLDLVNREDFEVQMQVLLRTREKLEALEHRVTELEAKLSEQD